MRKPVLLLLAALYFCGVLSAQNPNRPAAPVNVRGQVFDPLGGALQMIIRIQLTADNAHRPPEYIFTDSNGRFMLQNLTPEAEYTLTVESDGKNWATTTENFMPTGYRPTVSITLRPMEIMSMPGGTSVSLAELSENVPRAARREYAAAVELISQGDFDRARKRLERAIRLFPDFVQARNELAVALMRAGNLAEAEAQLRQALQVDAAAVRPTLNLGLCLYRQQRYADALPFLERGVQLQPVNANAHLVLGITLAISGDDTRAEPVLLRAYEQGGKRFTKAQLYLARLYTRKNDFPRAAVALETYLRDAPEDPDAESLHRTLEKLRAAARR